MESKNKIITKKRVILIAAIVIIVIAGGLIAKIKLESNEEKISTKAESTDNLSVESSNDDNKSNDNNSKANNNEEANKETSDNSGYLPLEKDSNADDAVAVFNVTDKLNKLEAKYPVRTDGKKIAYLTFDDGPSTTNTPKVLDILKQNNIKATFMIMGKEADSSEEAKEILKRTVKEGHAIGNHTYGHDYDYLYPFGSEGVRVINPTNFINDIDKCDSTLKGILGKDFTTRVIRFPGGYWSWEGRTGIRPIIDERGYGSINWNAESEDAEGKPNKTAEELIEASKKNMDILGPNADSVVFLMHDTYGKEETVKSLQGIIDMFKERGFEFKSLK